MQPHAGTGQSYSHAVKSHSGCSLDKVRIPQEAVFGLIML